MQNFEFTVSLSGKKFVGNNVVVFKNRFAKFVVGNCRPSSWGGTRCTPQDARMNAEDYARKNFTLNQWRVSKINGIDEFIYLTSIKPVSQRPVGDF